MRHAAIALLLTAFCAGAAMAQRTITEEKLPEVGDEATDFALQILGAKDKEEAKLHEQLENGPVVLLVLRGYPGYQCPVCSRQVGQFVGEAEKFAEKGATVWMVYPGPADDLERFATEFVANRELPENFRMLLDPDYKFTNAWHLRWDEPRETAYPSTFVIGTDKEIKFAKISKTHRGRTEPDEVLAEVPAERE